MYDACFGRIVRWDVDLLSGYDHEILPTRWPPLGNRQPRWHMLTAGIKKAVAERSWDGVLVFGYNYLNSWRVARQCRRRQIPLMHIGDTSLVLALERPAWKLWSKQLILRRFFHQVQICLAPGNSSHDYLRYYGVPETRIRFCPLPVDLRRFRQSLAEFTPADRNALRRRLGLSADDFVLTSIGKLMRRKRPHDLIAAIKHIGDPRIKALYIGSGEMEEELRREGGDCARLAGFINQSEVPRYAALGDVAVMPSSFDQHPLAVTESLGIGVPVLLSDRCGCYGPDDVVRDGEDGFVYPCGDVKALAARIVQLRDDPALRQRLGERGREIAETQTPQAAKAALVRCLEEISSQRKERTPFTECSQSPIASPT
jgi:glycosyltransferase involved in cell wall biosynthesis